MMYKSSDIASSKEDALAKGLSYYHAEDGCGRCGGHIKRLEYRGHWICTSCESVRNARYAKKQYSRKSTQDYFSRLNG